VSHQFVLVASKFDVELGVTGWQLQLAPTVVFGFNQRVVFALGIRATLGRWSSLNRHLHTTSLLAVCKCHGMVSANPEPIGAHQ
jgi:hypothetical protein